MRSQESRSSNTFRDDHDDDGERGHHPSTELDVLSRALSHRANVHADDVSIARSFVELHVPS